MLVSEILACDPELELKFARDQAISFTGMASPRHFSSQKIFFVKNSRFHQELISCLKERPQDLSHIGVIYESTLWDKFIEEKDEWAKKIQNEALALFVTKNVELSLCRLSKPFYEKKHSDLNDFVDGRQMGSSEIHPTALIAQGVFIGEGVKIGARVQIFSGCSILAGTEIDEDSILFPNVVLCRFTKIGKKCRIHSGTVIGADGFGYYFHQGIHHKIWHMGGVHIEDDVEIGAGSCVDQGTFFPTFIGSGTKIDNQVQVAHNCHIGKGVILCGQVGVAGSCILEDYVVAGGGAKIAPDLRIGKGTQIAGLAGVNTDWPAGSVIGGHPARALKEWLKGVAYVRKQSLSKGPSL